MKIAIDIDGTILPEGPTFDRYLKMPFQGAIKQINELYFKGHTIYFFTARSWSEYDITLSWLKDYGFQFHYLVCGKPVYDILVDDRSVSSLEQLEQKLKPT